MAKIGTQLALLPVAFSYRPIQACSTGLNLVVQQVQTQEKILVQ